MRRRQIIALGACYFFSVTALDITTNVGTIDDLTSLARILLVGWPCLWHSSQRALQTRYLTSGTGVLRRSTHWRLVATPNRAAAEARLGCLDSAVYVTPGCGPVWQGSSCSLSWKGFGACRRRRLRLPPRQADPAFVRTPAQVLPVAMLDAGFILWVFTALSKTLAQLQSRRAGAKLDLYR